MCAARCPLPSLSLLQLPSVWQQPKYGKLHWDALLEEMQVGRQSRKAFF
jgi:hypothetical protein